MTSTTQLLQAIAERAKHLNFQRPGTIAPEIVAKAKAEIDRHRVNVAGRLPSAPHILKTEQKHE